MDIYDQASVIEELDRMSALAKQAQAAAAARLMPTGLCLNCEDGVGEGVLFCHPTCTSDYELRKAAVKRTGRTGA